MIQVQSRRLKLLLTFVELDECWFVTGSKSDILEVYSDIAGKVNSRREGGCSY
jgi:hypothetical protein